MQNENVNYPNSDQIDPDLARFLYDKHCAILVVQNLPVGSEFGIDLTSYQVGPNFKGVKLIPPGIHFIYASALDIRNSRNGPRSGFFHNFKSKELVIKQWSSRDEEFDDNYIVTEEIRDRYRCNLRDLDRFLGPYQFSQYKNYLGLTTRLNDQLVRRLMPDCGKIRSVPFLVRDESSDDTDPPASSSRTEDAIDGRNLLPNLQPEQTTIIHFTEIPKTHKDAKYEVDTSQITQYNLDSTMKLDRAFGTNETGIRILLGEFQFAFLAFILCHVFDCLEQWKTILSLICLSETAMKDENMCSLYSDFIQILRLQIDYVPEDLFLSIDQRNNLIRSHMDTFFQNIKDNSNLQHVKLMLKPSADQLQSHLEQKYCWQFELEPDEEDEPVVVVDN